jgi:hypothetical protein
MQMKLGRLRFAAVTTLGTLVFACGGDSARAPIANAGTAASGAAGSTGASGGASGSPGGGSGGASGGAGSAAAACPSEPVTDGSSCEEPWQKSVQIVDVDAHCSWGDDPRPDCRTRAICDQGAWRVTAPAASCSEPLLPSDCPATPPDDGVECGRAGASCWYDDGTRCSCSECLGGSAWPLCQPIDPPEWKCASAPQDCPAVQPQAGAACANPGAYCGFDCELPIVCASGVWQWGYENCPICAAPDTAVATPDGERPIAELKAGDWVYSVESDEIVVVPILRVGSAQVSAHEVVRLLLNTGRVIEMSPRHPTASGTPIASLVTGQQLDELHTVASIETIPYRHERTYDILPASSTGTYFAAGALVGSSLAQNRSRLSSERLSPAR